MPRNTSRATGRPTKLGKPAFIKSNVPGLPQRKPGNAVIKVPLDTDGQPLYGRLVESKLRAILEDVDMLDGYVLQAKFGLRRVLRIDPENEEEGLVEMFEPISAREQQAASQFLLSRALPSIAMTGKLPGGVQTPGKEDEEDPRTAALAAQYS